MIPLHSTFTSGVRDVNADAVTTMNTGTRGGGGASTTFGIGNGTAIFQIHSRHVGVLMANARRAFSESFISNMAYAEDNAISPVTTFLQHALRALPVRLGGTARDNSIYLGPESEAIIVAATRYLVSNEQRGVEQGEEGRTLEYIPIRQQTDSYDIFDEPEEQGASAGDFMSPAGRHGRHLPPAANPHT